MTRSSSEQTQEIRPSKTQYYNVCKGSYSNGTTYIPDASAKLFVACATETQTHCVCDMGIGNPVRGSVYTVRSEVELPLKFKLRPNSVASNTFRRACRWF